MLDKISAYAKVIETQADLYTTLNMGHSNFREFYYSILYSTDVNECFDKENYIAIHYALKKSFTVKFINQEEIIINENTFFIAKRAQNYKLLQAEETICCIISILINRNYFTSELLSLIDENNDFAKFINDCYCEYSNPNLSNISAREKEYFHKLLDTIPIQNISSESSYKEYMILILKRILLFIDYHYKSSCYDPLSFKAKIFAYINENIRSASLPDLANKLHYNITYLSKKVYDLTGKKFSVLIKEEKVKKGKQMLDDTNYPLKQICYILGYENESSFVTAFKEFYNISPIAYRNNINEKE